MRQDQNQPLSSLQQPRRGGRGMQVVLIASALLVLMVLAVGIREYVGDQGAGVGSDLGSMPPTDTVEIDEEAWSSQGDSISGKFLASRHAERTGELGIAADLLLEILEAQPDNDDVKGRAHIMLAGEGRFEEARELAEEILAKDPDDVLANITMAMKLVEEEAYEDALGLILKIPHQSPYRMLAPMLEAWTFAGMGEAELSGESLTPLVLPAGSYNALKGLHGGLIGEIFADWVGAEEEYVFGLGDGTAIPIRLAETYAGFLTRQGRWDEAEAFVGKYRDQVTDKLLSEPFAAAIGERRELPAAVPNIKLGFAEAFYSAANIRNTAQSDILALILVHHALRLSPDNDRAKYLLGDILNSQERPRGSIEAFRRIEPDSPFSWYARLSVARMLADQDEVADAIDLLDVMIDERPDRTDAARALGDIQRVEEDYKAAVQAYDKAIERLEAQGEVDARFWQIYYTRGISLERRSVAKDLTREEKKEAWVRAEADFLKALELEPDQPHIMNYLGYSWVEKGTHLDEAREMIEKSVLQRPDDGYITDSMGWVLYRMREFEEAVVHLERAVELEPSDPIINDHLGDAYWLVGRENEARFQWKRALENEPEEKLAEGIRAKLSGEKEPEPKAPGEESDI